MSKVREMGRGLATENMLGNMGSYVCYMCTRRLISTQSNSMNALTVLL